MLQRRVRDDAAVPEIVGADLHHRQGRRQRAARNDVLGLDHFAGVVEIDEVAAQHIDRADREPHARALSIEIDQLLQRFEQRRAVVVAGGGVRAGRLSQGPGKRGSKNPGWPCIMVIQRAGGVARLAKDVAVRRVVPDLALGDPLPERAQPLEAPLLAVAGDDGELMAPIDTPDT